MTMPVSGYPHDLSDEELVGAIQKFTSWLTPNMNDVVRVAPIIAVGQAELQMRASNALKDAIEEFKISSEESSRALNSAIDELKTSSETAANRIQLLTVVLVALTASLLGATIALIVAG